MDEERKNRMREHQKSFGQSLKKTCLVFFAMTPMLVAIICLVGLLQVVVSPEMLSSFFSGNAVVDTLIGTLSGSVAQGNPVVSYLLGGELLEQGVSLFAVSAFILSWVTLGFVHLPLEAEMLGFRFTLHRNLTTYFITILVAILTSFTFQVLG